jgi:hypothetical protein
LPVLLRDDARAAQILPPRADAPQNTMPLRPDSRHSHFYVRSFQPFAKISQTQPDPAVQR